MVNESGSWPFKDCVILSLAVFWRSLYVWLSSNRVILFYLLLQAQMDSGSDLGIVENLYLPGEREPVILCWCVMHLGQGDTLKKHVLDRQWHCVSLRA